jgi:phage/plasmid-like protein (TIGR03299 family)
MSNDVNEAFAAEKADQIAAARQRGREFQARIDRGEIELLGDGRYRVLTGWDAGETFAVTRNEHGEIQQITANHGLDTTTGQVALYSAVPAWHGLGQIIPGGTSDIDEVLRLGGICFGVELREVRYNFGGNLHTMPDKSVCVRDDTGEALGVVGSRYTPIQNRTAFEFLHNLVDDYGVTWESAGATRGGRNVFVCMRLPQHITIDADGINDEIVPFIAAINSHDGSSPFRVIATPWRPICRNTERFAVRDAHSRWSVRHTASAMDRINEARRTLGLSIRYYQAWAAEETALAHTQITPGEFDKVLAELWPVDADASKRSTTIAEQRTTALHSLFASETDRVGRTAYAAERTITGYLDHLAPIRPPKTLTEELARATRVMEGTDDDKKTTAHKRLMTLVHR